MQRHAMFVLVVAIFGIASCQGVQERLDVLRVKKIEIVDDADKSKMNVETELRALQDRVAKLEAELAKARSAPPPPVVTPPVVTSPIRTPTTDAAAPLAPPRMPRELGF